MKKKLRIKELAENPVMLIIYVIIASVMVANIFISGYLFGRAHQTIESLRPVTPLHPPPTQPQK